MYPVTRDEKIDKLLTIYCDYVSIPHGEAYSIAFGDWSNLQGDELQNALKDETILKDRMNHLGLIFSQDFDGIIYQATPHGREIHDNGGWLKHLELKQSIATNEQTKKNLEFENLKLQNDNLNNELRDRIKKEEIDKLTIENLKLQNRNNRLWFLLIGGLLGIIAANFRLILSLFGVTID